MSVPLEALFKEGYKELLSLARARLARERAPISTLTLAHELYINLRGRAGLEFTSLPQFLAYSSTAMRSLLVDMARERLAQKRSAEILPLTLGKDVPDADGTPEQLLQLDEVLTRMGQIDARLVRIAEMRIIMGMDIATIALALDLSEPTIKRDWQRAKAYLQEALGAPG
jgi:RNA polymerase sigma factor (TIGR02999 family)